MKISKVLSVLLAVLFVAAFVGCSNPTVDSVKTIEVASEKGVEGPINKSAGAAPDAFENDDTPADATYEDYNFNRKRLHNFYDDPTDFIKFSAYSSYSYIIDTEIPEGSNADTVLEIYSDATLSNRLYYNDDIGYGDYSSRIIIKQPAGGTYYIKCKSYANRTGADREYTIRVQRIESADVSEFSNGSNDGWQLYAENGAWAEIDTKNTTQMELDVYSTGTNTWDIGLYKEGYDIAYRLKYGIEVTFAIKTESGKSRDIEVLVGQAVSPWTTYGSKTVTVDGSWQTVKLYVPTGEINDTNAQVALNFGSGTPMDFWIDNMTVVVLTKDLF